MPAFFCPSYLIHPNKGPDDAGDTSYERTSSGGPVCTVQWMIFPVFGILYIVSGVMRQGSQYKLLLPWGLAKQAATEPAVRIMYVFAFPITPADL